MTEIYHTMAHQHSLASLSLEEMVWLTVVVDLARQQPLGSTRSHHIWKQCMHIGVESVELQVHMPVEQLLI